MNDTIMKVENIKKYFPIKGGLLNRAVDYVKAIDGVSFDLNKGETLGIVGESGCGKSTTGRILLGLLQANSGAVIYKGLNITKLKGKELNKIRKDIQIVFQDPYGSLNPRHTVEGIIGEVFDIHKLVLSHERDKKIKELLNIVGLRAEQMHHYPHEFSGGQKQRIGIARALAVRPKIIIFDEPVSALDVSIQGQIINLIKELQKKFELSYIFISHDLSIVKYISDRVAVMYLGKVVEIGPKELIYKDPKHPYTQALLSSIPFPNPLKKRKRIVLKGDVPSPTNPPSGCRFHNRCWKARDECFQQEPSVKEVGAGHEVCCHLYNKMQ